MKCIGKIKRAIKRKNNKKLTPIEAVLEDETLRSKYTRGELEAKLESARRAKDTFDWEVKQRRREDRRRLVVDWIGGVFGFIGVNGSFIILAHLSGIIGLIFDKLKLWPTLAGFLLTAFWVGYVFLLYITFCWFSDKTGFYFWIEDWIVAWDTWDAGRSHNIRKFKEFPRMERRALVRDLNKELDVISDKLYHLEEEAYDNDDKKLSDSVESARLIISLSNVSSGLLRRSEFLWWHNASWKAFSLTLEETFNDLELELADIAKYHKKVRSLLKQAYQITAKVLFRVIDSGNREKAKKTAEAR